MTKLGEVEFSVVTDEVLTKDNEVSEFPTENKSTISDNVEQKPLKVSITGIVIGDGAFEKLKTLRKYSNNGEVVAYAGRNALDNCIIESLGTSHGGNIKGGFEFDIQLKQILIAELEETNIDFKVIKPQVVNKTKNVGKRNFRTVPIESEPNPRGFSTAPLFSEREAEEMLEAKKKYQTGRYNPYGTDSVLNKVSSNERRKSKKEKQNFSEYYASMGRR